MTKAEMETMIKQNLNIRGDERDLTISDIILMACDYCNISTECIPDELEPILRKKVKGIIDYEASVGTGFIPEVASIKEGDGSITWAQTEGNTKASIYELNDSDKRALRRHRRLRGYV